MESQLIADWNLEFYDRLIDNIKGGDDRMAKCRKMGNEYLPAEAKGVGRVEAPRGI